MNKLKSRKLWVTVLSVIGCVASHVAGAPAEAINQVVKIALGYLVAEGAADVVGRYRNNGTSS